MMELLQGSLMGKPAWMWAGFFAVILFLIVFDLGLLQRKNRGKEIGIKQSLRLSLFYITMGLVFGCFVWHELGAENGSDYFTGFIIEKSLSLDNIFVISLIFSYFKIPREYQYRVLFWGVIGVILLRGLLIGLGTQLIENFHGVMYLFGAFLIYTGVKMLTHDDEETNVEDNRVVKFIQRHLHVTSELHGSKFFVRLKDANTGKLKSFATPLFMTLVVVECVDLIFAMDSVPAIFAISTDEYVIFTSNVFAILGLRALYFALSAMLHRFKYLNYSLSIVLIFIGAKVFYRFVSDLDELPSSISLLITLGILAAGVIFSLYKTGKEEKAAQQKDAK